MRTIIEGGTIVNEGRTFDGTIIIEDGTITAIVPVGTIAPKDTITPDDEVIDAKGCYILPGIIDDHVHFREPGLTEKADIDTESRAAAAGCHHILRYAEYQSSDNHSGGIGAEILPGTTEESCQLQLFLWGDE